MGFIYLFLIYLERINLFAIKRDLFLFGSRISYNLFILYLFKIKYLIEVKVFERIGSILANRLRKYIEMKMSWNT